MRTANTAQLLLAPAACAGLCLGLLGLLESFYVAPFRLATQWYGFGLYGLLGLGLGLGWGLLFGGRARRRDFGLLRLTAQAAAWPTFGLAAVVAGFLVWRDLWAESIGGAGLGGWLAMLGVPVGAAVLALLARELSRVVVGRARRWALIVLLLALPGVLLARWIEGGGVAAPQPASSAGADRRPPVVVVVADALRADVIGAYGDAAGDTPNLDAFARDAVLFEEAWTASTWTRPAVASIMTGQLPAVHKTMHKADRLPEGLPTLAGLLRGHGYTTLGSVTNVNLAPEFGLGRGFDAWGYLAPRTQLGAPDGGRRLFLVELWRLARLRFLPGQREVEDYYAPGGRINAQARELIAPLIEAERPFFAYLHYMETHDPFFAHPVTGHAIARVEQPDPPLELADEMRDLYRQELRHWDGVLGELLDWCKQQGLYDRALIVVTSDHGEEFADHGHFWHGTSLYRELVRVPLLIRFPGGAGAGSRRSDSVSLIDLLPTALRATGLDPPAGLSGRALRPKPIVPAALPEALPEVLLEATATVVGDDGEAPAVADAPRPPARPLFAALDHQGCVLQAVRLDDWKLILANPDNPRGLAPTELYQLARDPAERHNMADSRPQQVERLQQVLQAGAQRAAAAPEVQPEQVEVDDSTAEQLRSLGYTE